jgi:hypothetical protein
LDASGACTGGTESDVTVVAEGAVGGTDLLFAVGDNGGRAGTGRGPRFFLILGIRKIKF